MWVGLGWALLGIALVAFIVQDLLSPTPGRLSLPRGAVSDVAAGPLSGTWTVGSGSEVGYRVHEVLFGLSHTAVGRTHRVAGTMTFSGSELVAADFRVQMASVLTNQAGREVMWRDYIMNTGAYPLASFQLSQPIRLATLPPVGKVVPVVATGRLTMRGVTRVVHFTIRGERVSAAAIDLNAEIPIVFREWKIPNPSFAITKVSNTGTLEVLLHLSRSGRG